MSDIHVDVDGRTLKISNLDKVLYPRTGTTKGEVLNYYASVAEVMLPHLRDRAVTRIRWPHGVQGNSFFEKNMSQHSHSMKLSLHLDNLSEYQNTHSSVLTVHNILSEPTEVQQQDTIALFRLALTHCLLNFNFQNTT